MYSDLTKLINRLSRDTEDGDPIRCDRVCEYEVGLRYVRQKLAQVLEDYHRCHGSLGADLPSYINTISEIVGNTSSVPGRPSNGT